MTYPYTIRYVGMVDLGIRKAVRLWGCCSQWWGLTDYIMLANSKDT